jgi:hypothetical protein
MPSRPKKTSTMPMATSTRLGVEGPAPVDGVDTADPATVGLGLTLMPNTLLVGLGLGDGAGVPL